MKEALNFEYTLRTAMQSLPPKKFEDVFKKKDRKKVAPPAPACGLYLEKVIY